jgi:hypothetical protein
LPRAKDFAVLSVSHLIEEMMASIGAEVNWRQETLQVLEETPCPPLASLG